MQRLTDADVSNEALPYYGALYEVDVAGAPASIFRVGFTAELGYEIMVPIAHTAQLWDAILAQKDLGVRLMGYVRLLAIPFAVFIITLILQTGSVPLRSDISTTSPSSTPFNLPLSDILLNLVPLIIFVTVLAVGLRFFSRAMVRLFTTFGKVLDIVIKLALALSIVQYFTGIFDVFGKWPLVSCAVNSLNKC